MWPKLPLNKCDPTHETFKLLNGRYDARHKKKKKSNKKKEHKKSEALPPRIYLPELSDLKITFFFSAQIFCLH